MTKPAENTVRTGVTALLLCTCITSAATVIGPGRSVGDALSALSGGDTLYLREGLYREEVAVDNVHGSAGSPIVVSSYPGETATIDGTVELTGAWTQHRGSVYKLSVSRDIWQLFIDREVVDVARYPNGSIRDGSIWEMQSTMIQPRDARTTWLQSNALAQAGVDFAGINAVSAGFEGAGRTRRSADMAPRLRRNDQRYLHGRQRR